MARQRFDTPTLPARLHHAVFVATPFRAIPDSAWRWLLGVLIALTAIAAVLPQRLAAVPLVLTYVVLIAAGIWRFWQHDVRRGVITQVVFANAVFTFAASAVAYALVPPGSQWIGDALRAYAYVLLIGSSVRTAHLRGPGDRASWIDAGIWGVSIITPIWALWIAPAIAEGNGHGTESVLFGGLALAFLFTGARFVLGGGAWNITVHATSWGGVVMVAMDFLVRGPLHVPIPLWLIAAPGLFLSSIALLHPAARDYYRRGVRVGGMSIATRLGLLACSATIPMAVLAAGFIQGDEIDWGVYAGVFTVTAAAVALRVELTRREGLSVWRPGALGAGATLVLFAVTGALAALGQSTEQRRVEAAALSGVVIAAQPLDGQMARAVATDPSAASVVREDWARQVEEARRAIWQVAIHPRTREAGATLTEGLQAYVRAARQELSSGGEEVAASSAAAYRRLVGDARAATRVAQQAATESAQTTRMVTVLLSAATVLLIAGLLLGYGAMQRRAELAAREAIDDLTGLGSRAALLRHLQDKLEDDAALARGEDVAVVSVDVVEGRRFRDSLGEAPYQDLLRGVADRLLTVVRDDDIVSRPRNDGFAVALAGRTVETEATVVAQRIVGAFVEPISVDGSPLTVSVSIGVAFAGDVPGDEPHVRASRLLKNGDLAAGDGGRSESGIRVFAPAMEAAARERIELAAELRRGIERGELRLFYQPLIDLTTGLPAGYEALMRWQHPTRGLVSPGVFIPVAERAGLIGELGGWALQEACRQLVEWQEGWGDVRYVSVNVAAAQLQNGKLLEQVHDALEASGLPPNQLQLEVTESSLMEDLETADRIMRQVQLLGVRWALDDFGTGYSSLSYLRRFPVQGLKIDKSFIDDITDDDTGGPLVAGIIEMARNLRLTVVAEGIEDAEQGMRVRAMGGDVGQGYLFSRPLPAEQVTELGRSIALPAPAVPAPAKTGLRVAR